jgi:hypothetical protein
MNKQQTSSKPKQPTDPIAAAEQVLADLDAQRRDLAAARAADDTARSKVAYRAHALHELGAVNTLSEITGRAIARDQQLREIDCAIVEARERLSAAKLVEARAADQARAEEARKLVKELGECFPFLGRHLAEAARALIAINDGFEELRKMGFASPTPDMVRLNICAIIQTWGQRLPKHWHNELRDGFRFLAPHERKTAEAYWAQVQASIDNQINQRLDKTEQPNKERAA